MEIIQLGILKSNVSLRGKNSYKQIKVSIQIFKKKVKKLMQETEKFLNGILEKRLGSVTNNSNFSKYGTSVTRIPRQQEKVQNMPTVFRKKHQTTYRPPTIQQSEYKSTVDYRSTYQPDSKKDNGTQRVEYMLISKRIESKEDQLITPTVDISKYKQPSQKISQDSQPELTNEQHIQKLWGNQQQQEIKKPPIPPSRSSKHLHHRNSFEEEKGEQFISESATQRKRKKIFSREKR